MQGRSGWAELSFSPLSEGPVSPAAWPYQGLRNLLRERVKGVFHHAPPFLNQQLERAFKISYGDSTYGDVGSVHSVLGVYFPTAARSLAVHALLFNLSLGPSLSGLADGFGLCSHWLFFQFQPLLACWCGFQPAHASLSLPLHPWFSGGELYRWCFIDTRVGPDQVDLCSWRCCL